MANNIIEVETEKKLYLTIILSVVFFFFSLYGGYSSSISVIFQLVYLAVILFLFLKQSSLAVLPLLSIISVRGYTQLSINSSVVDYYSLNGGIQFFLLLICAFILINKSRINKLSWFAVLPFMMFISQYLVNNVTEYGSNFNSICLLLLLAPYWVKDDDDIFIVHISFVVAGLLFTLGVIPNLLRGNTIYEIEALVDRNYQSGMALLCALESFVYLSKYNKLRGHIFFYLSIISMLGCIYIIVTSASRSAIISIIFGAFLYLLANKVNLKLFVFSVLIFFVFIYSGLKLGLFDFIIERFMLDNMTDANGRTEIWPQYVDAAFQSNPFYVLFGHGLVGVSHFHVAAHNVFISILYSFGLVGLSSLLLGYYIIVRSFLNNKQAELISFLPYIIMCMTIEPYYRIEYALFVPLMYGIAMIKSEINEK